MTRYSRVNKATRAIEKRHIPETRFRDGPPVVPHKSWEWLPEVEVGRDLTATETEVKEGPVESVGATEVTYTWTVRDKTAQELDEEKESRVQGMDLIQFQIEFDHENRLRVLEGKNPVSAAQFRAAIKARL